MEVQSIYGATDKTWNLQQHKIAECMSEQGFKYRAVPPSLTDPAQAFTRADAMQQSSYYSKYGYGVFTNPPGGKNTPPPVVTDPNQALTREMSGPEYAAYMNALNGSGPPASLPRREKGDTNTAWKYQGCTGQAEHAVSGGPGSDDDPAYESLRKAIAAFNEQAANGPEVVKAHEDWSLCMTKAGYVGMKTPADANIYVLNNGPKDGRNQKQEAAFEISVAKSDYGCQDRVRLGERTAKAENDAQAQFVSEHKAELDAWVAAARKFAGDNGLEADK